MAIPIIGQSGETLQVDVKHRALRASLRPLDVGAFGGYRISALSGVIAATLAANSPLFSFRWGDATRKAVIHSISAGIIVDGTITTAVAMILEAMFARSFTVADTGGTALTLTGNNGKEETAFGTTLASDIRMATTGTLTAGTRTLDTQGFGIVVGGSGTTAGALTAIPVQPLYNPVPGVEHPIVLTQNEGFIIKNSVAGPATGTFRLAVAVAWSEVASYNNAGL